MAKYRGKRHQGPAHAAPYPVSRLGAPVDLVEVAHEIEAADQMLKGVVGSKLEAIARQIRSLQAEAAATLEAAQRDAQLHRARCAFRKTPGRIYHLYERSGQQPYFSMLSPDEWGGDPPHAYLGSYRLEADMRWTPLTQSEEADRERAQLGRLLQATAPQGED